MNQAELFDALDGLMAYDLGATDSGIRDEGLRQRVIAHLSSLDPNGVRLTLGPYIDRYGLQGEDRAEFESWIRDDMGIFL